MIFAVLLACSWPGSADVERTHGLPTDFAPKDKWPEGFEWDLEKFPQLAEVELDELGIPVDPKFRPGPDGLPAPLMELVGYDVPDRVPYFGEPTKPAKSETQERPKPPARFRCDDDQTNQCFVRVPLLEGWVGAQSKDASAPAYDADAREAESPPFLASNGDYWIMAVEASVAHLLRCRAAGACTFPPELDEVLVEAERTQPARRVTLMEAEAVCRFHKARLPTEEEWELAARGAEGRRFPWGDEPGCGVLEGAVQSTCERQRAVHGNAHGPHGTLHMGGNLAEWTSSLAAAYTEGGLGTPAEGESRMVVRGGSWKSEDPLDHRAAARSYVSATTRRDDLGFRCVWSPGKGK